jgi:tetratricopeptide (TPR) repeat protein
MDLSEKNKLGDAELLSAYRGYLKLTPGDKTVQIKAAKIERKDKNPVIRENAFRKLVELEPRNIENMLELGAFYIKQKKNQKARIVLQKAFEINSNDPDLLNLIVENYDAMGLKSDVARILEKQLASEIDLKAKDKIRKRLGDIYMDLKDENKALKHYEPYIKNNKNDKKTQKTLLGIYRKSKREQFVKVTLDALIPLEPKNINYLQERQGRSEIIRQSRR